MGRTKNMSEHGKEEKFTYDCYMCAAKFDNHYELERHMRRRDHLNQRNFKCEMCGVAFALEQNLRRHYKSVKHEQSRNKSQMPIVMTLANVEIKAEPGANPLQCTMCSKEFSRSDALRRHWRVHETDKRIPCPFNEILNCGKTFYRTDALKRHLERNDHSQEELERHQSQAHQTHQNQCDYCGKGFYKAHALRVHSCPVKHQKKWSSSKALKKGWQRREFGRRLVKRSQKSSEESTALGQTMMLMECKEEPDSIIDETVS